MLGPHIWGSAPVAAFMISASVRQSLRTRSSWIDSKNWGTDWLVGLVLGSGIQSSKGSIQLRFPSTPRLELERRADRALPVGRRREVGLPGSADAVDLGDRFRGRE